MITMNIACVGEMVIDFLPGSGEGEYIRKAGGAPANVAVAVARNGLDAGFCGKVGNDDFGRFLVKTLEKENVAVLCPQLCEEAVTTMAFVSLDEHGNRSFTFARKPGADMLLTVDEVERSGAATADMVHAGSCSLSRAPASDATVYAMRKAKENGKLVSFDVNYRNLMWNDDRAACCEAVRKILPLVDFLKISEEELDVPGVAPEKIGEVYGISVVVTTLGGDGAVCYWNGRKISIPGRKARVVDTTGAGDAFWGGFLSCLLKSNVRTTADLSEDLLKKALVYGNVAGWLCVQQKGAMESLPSTQQIEAIAKEEV